MNIEIWFLKICFEIELFNKYDSEYFVLFDIGISWASYYRWFGIRF